MIFLKFIDKTIAFGTIIMLKESLADKWTFKSVRVATMTIHSRTMAT